MFLTLRIKPSEQVLDSYNFSMLNDIGCSAWLKYLDNFNTEDLDDFYKGVQIAINNIDSEHDSGCVQELTKSLPETGE